MNKQAKCKPCNIILEWAGLPKVRDAFCPYCLRRMTRSTHLCLLPRITQRPFSEERRRQEKAHEGAQA